MGSGRKLERREDGRALLRRHGMAHPSEAQWEYAALAGRDEARYEKMAVHAGNPEGVARNVGELEPNAFGLHDMLGNVSEWCADWYIQRGYRSLPSRPGDGLKATVFEGAGRVLRGGDFTMPPVDIDARRRVASRSGAHPTAGVRPVLTARR